MKRSKAIFNIIPIFLGLVLVGTWGCSKKVNMAKAQIGEEESHSPQSQPKFEGFQEPVHTANKTMMDTHLRLADIFFDFDRNIIREDAKRILEENVRWLKDNPNAQIIIQGHADERGTNDYNLVLGERRAMAIKRYLLARGIEPQRINTISYGEEKPFCRDRSEMCWQENRRGHFSRVN